MDSACIMHTSELDHADSTSPMLSKYGPACCPNIDCVSGLACGGLAKVSKPNGTIGTRDHHIADLGLSAHRKDRESMFFA